MNRTRIEELLAKGLVEARGRAAWEARNDEDHQYSFERDDPELGEEYEAELRANEEAWAFWQAQPPGYRKGATWWVISAKREDTRRRRLATLVADCAAGLRIKQLRR
mgnify:CR=1 FL=1